MTISSARTASPAPSARASGNSARGGLPSVGSPAGQDLQELFHVLFRRCQLFQNPSRLPVDRHRGCRPGIEDHDANGRGVYQRLQVGPGPAARPGAGGRWRSPAPPGDAKHDQGLFILLAELLARVRSWPRRCCPRPRGGWERPGRSSPERAGGTRAGPSTSCGRARSSDSQRAGDGAEVLYELRPLRQFPEPPGLVGGETGAQEVLNASRTVPGGPSPRSGRRSATGRCRGPPTAPCRGRGSR